MPLVRTYPNPNCKCAVPPSEETCPSCNWRVGYPNVDITRLPEEKDALQKRYESAKTQCAARKCQGQLLAFEVDVRDNSKAVIVRTIGEVTMLAASEKRLHSTYEQQVWGRARLPDGNEWDMLRNDVGTTLFPGYSENIQFAALTLNERGSVNYGEMHLVLKSGSIAERASVFEENSALHFKKVQYTLDQRMNFPPGLRAEWADRGKLAAAKCAPRIDPNTNPADHSSVLFVAGKNGWDDDFIEVNFHGRMNILTVEKVIYVKRKDKPVSGRHKKKQVGNNAEVLALKDRICGFGIAFEEVQA